MVTDRVSTCGLLVVLAQFYPLYSFWFTFLIVLDITSHWFHVMRYERQIRTLFWTIFTNETIYCLQCDRAPQVYGGPGAPQRLAALVLFDLPALWLLLRGHGVLLHSALCAPLLPPSVCVSGKHQCCCF